MASYMIRHDKKRIGYAKKKATLNYHQYEFYTTVVFRMTNDCPQNAHHAQRIEEYRYKAQEAKCRALDYEYLVDSINAKRNVIRVPLLFFIHH